MTLKYTNLFVLAEQFEHRGPLNIRKQMKYEDLPDNPELDYDPNPEDAHFYLSKEGKGNQVYDIGSKIEIVK